MDEPRFYQRPGFYIFIWTVILGGVYLWQVRGQGGILANFYSVLFDGCFFVAGLVVWLAFFAQFVLPVHTFRERQKIFDRLVTYISGGHGPAIFIRDGKPIERLGEEKKKGPGVLWLDSASAAVTRTATKFEKVIGPGVHFTEHGETLAGTVDLHAQRQGLGPREKEDPFAEKREDQSGEEYEEIQKRRLATSAWTRDGIEVVPNISVTFKIDADPVNDPAVPGSRFGYREDSVFKAVVGEGVNPDVTGDAPRRRVAWNQLPALVAADLWREYLAQFKLKQLFEQSQRMISKAVTPLSQIPAETQVLPPSTPTGGGALAGMLHVLNTWLAHWIDKCESGGQAPIRVIPDAAKLFGASSQKDSGLQYETALQTINRMVKARMTEPFVEELDKAGNPAGLPPRKSDEFELLTKRGIRVISVGIDNLRFPPQVEDQLVRQWSTTWLDSAKAERDRIERLRGFVELDGQVDAVLAYASALSRGLDKIEPNEPKDTLKTLLLRSRDQLVDDDRMHRRASMEREELEELIQWVERNGG